MTPIHFPFHQCTERCDPTVASRPLLELCSDTHNHPGQKDIMTRAGHLAHSSIYVECIDHSVAQVVVFCTFSKPILMRTCKSEWPLVSASGTLLSSLVRTLSASRFLHERQKTDRNCPTLPFPLTKRSDCARMHIVGSKYKCMVRVICLEGRVY